MMKTIFLLFLLGCTQILAQGSSTGMASIRLPLLARSASLGDATAADISSSSYPSNPSLLGATDGVSFSLSHQEWVEGIHSEYFTSMIPMSFGAAAFSVSSTSVPGIELRDIPGPPLGEFTARSATFAGTAAFHVTEQVSAGFSMQYLYEKIFVDDASGYALDFGASFRPSVEGLEFGAALLHAGSMNRLRSSRASLPTTVQFGASYMLSLDDFELLFLGTQGLSLENHNNNLHTGIEAMYLQTICLRLGYQSGFISRNLSYGVGIQYDRMHFDYGFVPFELSLGNAHIITLGLAL